VKALKAIRKRLQKTKNDVELSVAALVCAAAKVSSRGLDKLALKNELRWVLETNKEADGELAKLCRTLLEVLGCDDAGN